MESLHKLRVSAVCRRAERAEEPVPEGAHGDELYQQPGRVCEVGEAEEAA